MLCTYICIYMYIHRYIYNHINLHIQIHMSTCTHALYKLYIYLIHMLWLLRCAQVRQTFLAQSPFLELEVWGPTVNIFRWNWWNQLQWDMHGTVHGVKHCIVIGTLLVSICIPFVSRTFVIPTLEKLDMLRHQWIFVEMFMGPMLGEWVAQQIVQGAKISTNFLKIMLFDLFDLFACSTSPQCPHHFVDLWWSVSVSVRYPGILLSMAWWKIVSCLHDLILPCLPSNLNPSSPSSPRS